MLPSAALVGELTADGERIVLIANGPDFQLARLAKLLQTLTPSFAKTNPPGALSVPATWAAVVQLSHAFGDVWRTGPRLTEWVRAELLRRTGGGKLDYTPPEGYTPRPYQVAGAAMLATVGRVLLFDDPGTGKTITTILGLVERANAGAPVFPVVAVVPASTVDPWVQAWRDWAPHVRVVAWRGVPDKRHKLAGTADVYVTSYDTARMDAGDARGKLCKLKPAAVIVDECHLIKSPHAQRSLAVRRLATKAEAFVGLSGTPITHTPADLWPALEALEPHAWPSRQPWVDRYCQKLRVDYGPEEIVGLASHTEAELRTALLGQHRRVAKADVLTQLPPKVYTTRVVELPPAYRKAYDDMEEQMFASLPDGGELSVMNVLTQLGRLYQLASSAADVEVTYEPNPDGEGPDVEHVHVTLRAPSWKVDELLAVLDERPGQPVVAFSPSAQLVKLAAEAATKSGRRVGLVVGGQTMTDRTQTVADFQAGKLDLLCVTTGAGGVGLTLTAAGTVVFLQRPWSIVEATQAEDRCHRIGSERHDSIEVIDIVASNTVDSRVRAVLRGKAGQLADLLQDQRIVAELFGGTKRKGAVA